MAAFDRDNVTGNRQFKNDRRPEFADYVRTNAPAWIAGFVVLVAIIGAFAYESGNWGTHAGVDAAPTHDASQAPAPPPPAAPPVHP